MKAVRIIFTVIITVVMLVYMVLGSVLFAVDLSFDEQNVQKALESSDSFASLMHSAELSINKDFELDAENTAAEFGANTENIELSKIYSLPEASALFADIFTGSSRYLLYGEEYTEVSEELVRNYLCAVANYTSDNSISEGELEDYLSVKLPTYTARFNESVANAFEAFDEEPEVISTIRFLFGDLKVICIVGAVIHMLVLILLIRGRLGYFCCAGVFGITGISMLLIGSNIMSVADGILPSTSYSQIVSDVFRERFALVGAVIFAVFSLFMAAALIMFIRSDSKKTA